MAKQKVPPPPKPGPVLDAKDVQRLRWGGQAERQGRRVEGRIVEATKAQYYFQLTIRSTDDSSLKPPVLFHLDGSYRRNVIRIQKIQENDTAVFGPWNANGLFTVGVQVLDASGQWIGLEFDLASLDGLPERFVPYVFYRRRSNFSNPTNERTFRMMPGTTVQEIQTAILNAYEDDELRATVRMLMDVRLNNVVKPAPFESRVFEFIEWSERQGREVELITATAKARPKNGKMQAIYKKYGMAVPVYVEQAGAAIEGAPSDVVDGGLEKIVRPHLSFKDFGIWRERMTQVEGRVCLITLNGAAQGTGFLVGPDAVLTNYHVMKPVIDQKVKPVAVECVFDFKQHPNNTTTQTPVKLHKDWLIEFSEYSPSEAAGTPDKADPTADQLDYALIRLADTVGTNPWSPNPGESAPSRGWVRVPDAAPIFQSPMGVLIAQHPAGQPLKLAVDTEAINQANNLGLNKAQNRVRYATNTLGGSSGSPVFDLEWNLIALHHYGDPAFNHKPKFNQGVPIHLIRTRLAKSDKVKFLGGDPA